MSKRLLTAIVACGLLMTAYGQASGAADAAIGKRVETFSLRDFHGQPHSLADFADKRAVVIVMLGADCPMARLYCAAVGRAAHQFRERGVAFLGVDSNANDTPTKLTRFAQNYGVDFPLLKDAGNTLADQLGATRTPEAFVLDENRVVRYHGRIDDQFLVGVQRGKATTHDLADALNELLDGKPVSRASTPFTGCLIARCARSSPAARSPTRSTWPRF